MQKLSHNKTLSKAENKMFGLVLPRDGKSDILEKIKKAIEQKKQFFHIVSLNPENIVIAQQNNIFKKILSEGDIKLIDGVGIVIAARFLGVTVGSRTTGADMMAEILHTVNGRSLRIVLLGGKHGLAENLSDCYSNEYPSFKFIGLEGYSDIGNPKQDEDATVLNTIRDFRPDIIFAAFGSPYQELWFDRHKSLLNGVVCMGVGGGFDFAAKRVSRAPVIMRQIGLEWLYRLLLQPWRWKRQLRLLQFIKLVYEEKQKNRH